MAEVSIRKLTFYLGIHRSKLYQWKKRYGQENRHNGSMNKEHWITQAEKEAVIDFYEQHRSEGYRAVAYMMIDADVAYVSCSSVYRILREHDLIRSKKNKPSTKGDGFEQPLSVHEHWHTDISYLKIAKRFYFFIGVLDGCSRYLVHWEIRETMTERDAEIVVKRALEKNPSARPRLITDNGSQYTAHEFKHFVAAHGLTHVRTSPYYPQSNGKIERFHGTYKNESIRKKCPLTIEEAQKITEKYVAHYNNHRLHSAIGFVTPKVKFQGREQQVFNERKEKLEKARIMRKNQFAMLTQAC